MVLAGRMALFDVALRSVLLFVLASAVLYATLEWIVCLDLARESSVPFGC